MSDLIDRQALLKQIDIDSDGEPGYYGDTWKFIDTIKNMPNVHDLPKDTDTISRQAAIDAFNTNIDELVVSGKENADAVERYINRVIDAIKQLPPAQLGTDLAEVGMDAVSRKAVKELAYSQIRSMYCGVALKEQRETMLRIADNVIGLLAPVASKQSEIIRCKDCQYWNKGSCECPEHAVNCQDYYVGDIETEAEYFCGYAERRNDG